MWVLKLSLRQLKHRMRNEGKNINEVIGDAISPMVEDIGQQINDIDLAWRVAYGALEAAGKRAKGRR